jgi:F-type H+-transporting ATPase subunit b
MDVILHQLGELLLKAVPTFILVVLLHFYLKNVFFKPLEKVLHQRYEATDGARKLAEQSLERAAAKTAEYEAAMRSARAEVYQAQEQIHKRLQEQHAAQMAEARRRAEGLIQEAKHRIAQEVESAKATLAAESDALAEEIARTILRGSAA